MNHFIFRLLRTNYFIWKGSEINDFFDYRKDFPVNFRSPVQSEDMQIVLSCMQRISDMIALFCGIADLFVRIEKEELLSLAVRARLDLQSILSVT